MAQVLAPLLKALSEELPQEIIFAVPIKKMVQCQTITRCTGGKNMQPVLWLYGRNGV
jgi:hypothetical protein